MKRILIALAVFSLCATGTLMAEQFTVKASIPFEFAIGAKTLPAGVYTFERGVADLAISVRDAARTAQVMFVPATAAQGALNDPPKLVFRKYGNHYFLNLVQLNQGRGMVLRQNRAERELAARGPFQEVRVAFLAR